MDKRVLIASVVSMGVVLIYVAFFAKPKTNPENKPAEQQQQQVQPPTTNPATAQAVADAAKEQPKAEAEKPAAEKTAGPPAPPAPKAAPVEATFEQDKHYTATFTSEGAAPKSWVLLNPQYKEDKPKESNKKADQIDLVRTRSPNLPFTVTILQQSAIYLPPEAVWTEEPRGSDGSLTYSWENEAARVTKHYAQQPGSYAIKVDVTVENKTDKPQWYFFQVQMHGWQDPSIKPGGFLSRPVSQTVGACYVDGKTHKGTLEELLKRKDDKLVGNIDQRGDVGWVGVHEQYFLQGVALAKSNEEKDKRVCDVYAGADGSISAIMTVAQRDVAPHGKTTYEMAGFMGPKILSQLDAVTVGGQSAHFGDVMEYRIWGLTEWLARPMLAVLKAIHFVVPSWGFAIIVLTILVKALTWFPTQSSMKSMKAMAKLKPQMDKLKERYGDDKNALNMATMEMYRKEGVNPLGGCLPILIQMPIYIALYSMLGNSVELYRSPFLWVHDLTSPDPYYIMPILTGALMFLQQKTQPTPADPNQKVMMYTMPVMFTVFNLVWPAGLTIYILTNTILTFLQQWLMNRGDKPAKPKAVSTKPARA
jgi:YidC/Oxa1 family membrane protein insertase